MMLRTARLCLRRWTPSDLEPFAALNRDPEVMRYFPALRDRAESAASMERIEASFEANGFGFWAMELPGAGFIGFCGLAVPGFAAHFTPCVEIGWRMALAHWGRGYATEAARAAFFQLAKNGRAHEVRAARAVAAVIMAGAAEAQTVDRSRERSGGATDESVLVGHPENFCNLPRERKPHLAKIF